MPGDVNRDCAIRCLLDGAHFIFDAQLTLVELDEGSIETLVHAELLVRIVRMDERDTKVRIPIFGRGCASKRQRNEVRPLCNIGPTIGHAVVKRSQFVKSECGELRRNLQYAFGLDPPVVNECGQVGHQSGGPVGIGSAQSRKIRRLPWCRRNRYPGHAQDLASSHIDCLSHHANGASPKRSRSTIARITSSCATANTKRSSILMAA